MILNRRNFVVGAAALAAGASVSAPFFLPKSHPARRAKRSRVAILNVEQYSQRIDEVLAFGLRLFRINVHGKTVILKPNLVDYIPGNAINTHPTLVLAAAESFRRMGAKCVIVAEGPGHQRDTELVLSESGYRDSLRDQAINFVDLNRDELVRTQLRASYMGMKNLWLPRTLLGADFLVSMPKNQNKSSLVEFRSVGAVKSFSSHPSAPIPRASRRRFLAIPTTSSSANIFGDGGF
jgi:uncharacterized protein (DUF362 family)